jgi:hypothetical protein
MSWARERQANQARKREAGKLEQRQEEFYLFSQAEREIVMWCFVGCFAVFEIILSLRVARFSAAVEFTPVVDIHNSFSIGGGKTQSTCVSSRALIFFLVVLTSA